MAKHKNKNKSVAWIVLSGLAGLLVFLIMLAAVNYLGNFIDNSVFHQVVQFLNNNVVLIVLMSIIFLFGEIFGALIFPFNLPAPLFNAAGSVFLVTFIFRILELIETITSENIFEFFRIFLPFIYFLVFITVLIGGYILIFARLFKGGEKTENEEEKKPPEKKTWDDVGGEFRQTLYDLLHLIRESINKKRQG